MGSGRGEVESPARGRPLTRVVLVVAAAGAGAVAVAVAVVVVVVVVVVFVALSDPDEVEGLGPSCIMELWGINMADLCAREREAFMSS